MKKELNKRQSERIRRFASRGLFESTDKNARIKWAETDQDFGQAFELLYDRYLKLGYIQESKSFPLHYNIYNLLPDTQKAVLKKNGAVMSTVDIVMDNEQFGLPMDGIYHTELEDLRGQGRKLCEVGSLACAQEAKLAKHIHAAFSCCFLACTQKRHQ